MISIEPTNQTPKVEFLPNGKFIMEGRSMPENVVAFYDPIIQFVQVKASGDIVFDINLEYFNTATSKKLLELLRHMEANSRIKSILVNWYFEEGDEDSLETAEIYEESLMRVEFRYRELAEA